jgi:drug/metabolite transporter (DMT)-like permease
MAIVLGLLAALGWGTTDLLARISGRRLGVLRAMFFGQCVGLLVLSGWLVFDPSARGALGGGLAGWGAAVVAAGLNICAAAAFFRALTIGRLALVAPVAASYGAVTALLAFFAGETLSGVTMSGMALTVGGVALASSAPGRQRAEPAAPVGIGLALVAALGFGCGSWILGTFAVPALGQGLPIWLYFALSVATLKMVSVGWGRPLALPRGIAWLLVIANGALGSGAFLAFSVGLATGQVAIVTVLSSLSSAVTVLLACVLLKEPLLMRQWLGISGIVLGLMLTNGGR